MIPLGPINEIRCDANAAIQDAPGIPHRLELYKAAVTMAGLDVGALRPPFQRSSFPAAARARPRNVEIVQLGSDPDQLFVQVRPDSLVTAAL
jgi:hypothetical protein